jgi:hypothetical protein
MSASYQFIIDTGTVVADTSTLLSDVEAEYQVALGASIDLASSTPQGTLIAAETIARSSVMKNNADMANLLNPNLSYGVFLDAICAFLGVQRGQNASTQGNGVELVGDGVDTVTVPAGSRVQTSNGDIFYLAVATTIENGGTVNGNFLSQAYGNIPLPEETLTIIDGTVGWGAAIVTADTVVTPGTVELTDPQLKTTRNQQLATQGVGGSGAIASAVSEVANVTSANVVENNTGQFASPINGVTFTLPNAMWACIAGSAPVQDIANALYAAHQGGCPWDYGASGEGVPVESPNGVLVYDPITNQPYYVKYTTPALFDVYVAITVVQKQSVSSPVPAVQAAIINYTSGQEQGEPGLVVGADVSAFEMSGAVARQIPGMYTRSCLVAAVPAGSAAPIYPTDYVTEFVMQPWQQGQLAINNIAVTVDNS